MNVPEQQIIDNQKEIIRDLELMLNNESFSEHLTDHLIIATSFFALGILVCISLFFHLYKKKVRVDYDIEEGTVIRVERKKGTLLIVRPATLMQFYDMILLSFFDKGEGKYICKQSAKKMRIILYVTLSLTILLIFSGFTLFFSAFPTDFNIFNYIFE